MKKPNHPIDPQIQAAQARLEALRQRVLRSTSESDASPRALVEGTLDELATNLEELHVAQEKLREQNGELLAVREQLERERRRYQLLFACAPDGYVVTDAQGKIEEANRAAT